MQSNYSIYLDISILSLKEGSDHLEADEVLESDIKPSISIED